MQEVARLKERLKSKHHQYQQNLSQATETNEKMEGTISNAAAQLKAEKENVASLNMQMESLKKTQASLLAAMEAKGHNAIAGVDFESLEVQDATNVDEVEQNLAVAKQMAEETAALQKETSGTFDSIWNEIQPLMVST